MRGRLHFFHEGLAIGDDVGVAYNFEELHLHECLLYLLLVHLGDVDDLHDVLLFALLRLHQHRVPETPLPHDLHLPILLHRFNLYITF